MQDQAYETQLKEIWKQGQRGIVADFLKRVLQPQATLADIVAALQFAEVHPHLANIRLRDVLSSTPTAAQGLPSAPRQRPAAAAPAPAAPARAPAPAAAPNRRRRRGPEQMQAIKEQLWKLLQQEPGSLDTTQLHESLAQLGHDVDRITLKRLLLALQQEGRVACLGGRPKAWRQVHATADKQHVV